MVPSPEPLRPPTFARLVWRLRIRHFRPRTTMEKLNFAMVLVLMAIGVLGATGLVVAVRSSSDGAMFVAFELTLIALGWILLPVPFAAGNTPVDPKLYAMYPVRRRTLGFGMLAAAFVSLPALGSALVASSTLVHATSLGSGVVILIAAVLFVVTLVLSAQAVMLWFSSSLQRRWLREFAAGLGVIVAIGIAFVPQFLISTLSTATQAEAALDWIRDADGWVAWVPWGWAPSMFQAGADGRWGAAMYFGLLAIVWIAVLFWVWSLGLGRALTERSVRANRKGVAWLVTPRQERIFGSELAATTVRAQRELYRDNRQLMEIATWLPVIFFSAVPAWDGIRSGRDELVITAGLAGVAVGTSAMNVLGFDGRDFGVDVLVDRDLGLTLRGKLLARVLLGAVMTLGAAVLLAALTGGWHFVPSSFMLGLSGLLVMVCLGSVVSVRYAYPMPPKAGVSSAMHNPGCALTLVRVVAMVAVFVVMSPVAAGVVTASLLWGAPAGMALSALSVAVAIVVYRYSVRAAGRSLGATAPELFQVLSTPTTAS